MILLAMSAAVLVAPASAAQAALEPVYAAPARLPWGDLAAPHPAKAAPPTSAAQLSKNRVALKGAPSKRAAKSTASYFYAGGIQTVPTGTTAAYANVGIATPSRGAASHTLAEIAGIQYNSSLRQIVEIGWTVDNGLNGDNNPHLFCYWWKNDKGQGYNAGSGFVAYGTPSATCGQSLSTLSGTTKKMGIVHTGGAWWLAYDTGWVGYYPDALWTSTANGIPPSNSPAVTFNTVGELQMFGEIAFGSAVNASTVCTDMGNAVLGSATVAPLSASFGTAAIDTPSGTGQAAVMTNLGIPDPTYWNSQITSSGRTVRYGGPGAC